MGGSSSVPQKSIHEFTVKDSKGKEVDLSIYKGKVVLIVNVASKCGFTNANYPKLTQLYKKYNTKDTLELFMQEPASSEKVEEFACTRFNTEFPIFNKVRVNGPNAAPVYKFLKASKGTIFGSSIKWNFTKFLIDKEGRVIGRYGTTTSPLSIEGDIQKALDKE
nr:probable glutathione peroxidase 5 [Tanacetum cinerariifolium]